MASREHLQQLHDADESSTTSDSGSSLSSSDDESSDGPHDIGNADSDVVEVVEPSPVIEPQRPRPKLKLSLRMPKKKKETSEEEQQKRDENEMDTAAASSVADSTDADDDVGDEDEVVKATVVPSDGEDAEEVVQATVAEEGPAVAKVASATPSQPAPKPPKTRRSPTPFLQAGRPVRLPSMSSPGLLIPPTAGVYRGNADANGFTTPASVFSRAMSLAGYNTEGRTRHPHRGSSVERVVGDMFDSNVRFSLHFPSLVPEDLWTNAASQNQQSSDEMVLDDEGSSLPQLLIRAVTKPEEDTMKIADTEDTSLKGQNGRKRKACPSFVDMAPVSLTIPYPESYIQKRLDYIKKVEQRERAIVANQESMQKAEDAKEAYEEASAAASKRGENGQLTPPLDPPKIEIPPIPIPPSPPSEMEGDYFESTDQSQHPIRIIKGKEKFVAHLDRECFHVTDGRYYGLSTNAIADPHFVGPNAPGIMGLNVSGGTGLATSASHAGTAASAQAYLGRSSGGGGIASVARSKSPVDATKGSTKKITLVPPGSAKTTLTKIPKSGDTGLAVTSSPTDLKKFMEQDETALVEAMKVCIIRAAVHASRTGLHGGSFVGSDGETYPDISKAFAAHAGLRPCNRCKNNKQGAYHCRLRRKHKDIDYDGGNSWSMLAPLFEEKMEDLINS